MRAVFLQVRLAVFLLFAVFSCLLAERAECADEVFSWRQASGQTIRVLLSRHPYSEGMRRRLVDFENLTGIRVAYVMYPEVRYFSELESAFRDPSYSPDVYMTGVYQVWDYAINGRMLALDSLITNPAATRQGYDLTDFYPNISGVFRWNGKAGSRLGEGPMWAIPMGFESSALTYNREILARHRLPVPSSLEEVIETGRQLREFEGEGTYGVAARGVGEWNSVHSGYMTAFANYGATDMAVEGGRLVSKVNSPEAVAVTDLWIQMLRECGPEDWEYYDWVRCLRDIGERKTAILLDSDVLGFFANAPGASSQSGKLGCAPPPMPAGSDLSQAKSNLWVWGLAVNPATEQEMAAWLFVQYFTSKEFQSYSVFEWKSLNPPRRSVFEDPLFQRSVASMHGYSETFSAMIGNTAVQFTPNPYFIDISKRWAAVIRDVANGMYGSTQEGMDALKIWMDEKLSKVAVE